MRLGRLAMRRWKRAMLRLRCWVLCDWGRFGVFVVVGASEIRAATRWSRMYLSNWSSRSELPREDGQVQRRWSSWSRVHCRAGMDWSYLQRSSRNGDVGGVWLLPLDNAGTHGGTTKSSVGGTNNNINGIKCNKYSLHKSLIPASFIFDTRFLFWVSICKFC